MTKILTENEEGNIIKKEKSLTPRQKFLFGMICWGVQSWSQAKKFKQDGYDQKYKDALRSMYTGLAIYGSSIIILTLIILFLKLT